MGPGSKRAAIATSALAAIGLIAALFVSFRARGSDQNAPARPHTTNTSSRPAELRAIPTAQPPRLLETAHVAAAGEPAPGGESPLDTYLRNAIYPPTSRPLRPGHDDLIHPNRPPTSFRGADTDAEVTYRLTADKY